MFIFEAYIEPLPNLAGEYPYERERHLFFFLGGGQGLIINRLKFEGKFCFRVISKIYKTPVNF